MKKLTPFLFSLLIVLVGVMFLCRYLGIMQPQMYYSQIENQKLSAQVPAVEAEDFDTLILPSYYNCMDN